MPNSSNQSSWRNTAANKPLEGVRVLEFTALIAGPSCARFLSDHGAEVIKIERHPGGDISRHSFSTSNPERGAMFLQHNAGKQSICIDLKQPEGVRLALELVAKSDVVIEAFTPGVMERLGLGYEALRAVNPAIILCSVSGFGQTGPNANRPGYAHVSHAMSGWLALQFLHREPPEAPRGPGVAIGDTTAGLTAFGAVCASLFNRERTGRGDHIDISLFDALFCSNDFTYQAALNADAGEIEVWYHPVHATRDGYVTANVGPDMRAWSNVCKAMGRLELLDDPRFDTQAHVNANAQIAAEIVGEWMATLTSREAEAVLDAHHVPCAPVLTVGEAVHQPQVIERELVVSVDDPILGPIQTMNSAFRYANVTVGVAGPAPILGEHNETVLKDILGFDDGAIAKLREQGVLRSGAR
jgi:crotonobetainyl-CoA:carnitine CoA-transferase CaiB-like acyl-CoA transferase